MNDFWTFHGIGFLICIVLFPRITLLCATVIGGGFWYWTGWILWPRLVIAILATTCFWSTNPVLCIIAWLITPIQIIDWGIVAAKVAST